MELGILRYSNNTHYGNDFYNFINDSWINLNKIPDDYQRWGTFQELENNNLKKIKKILEQTQTDENFLKVVTLYNQTNNIQKRISEENISELHNLLDKIFNQTSHNKLFLLMIDLEINIGINLPISFYVGSNYTNSKENILHIGSGGLGLPDRDFYFMESKIPICEKYKEFIEKYGKLFGKNLNSNEIFNLEKQLAEKTLTKIQKRNTELTNNVIDFNVFMSTNPKLGFLRRIFERANKTPGLVNIINTDYMIYLNSLIESVDINLWKQYFSFHLLLEFNYCVSFDVEEEYFNFYSKTLKGTQKMKFQWTRTIENLNSVIGELIGIMYSYKYFKPESKKLAYEIVNLIKDELKDYLIYNDWMETNTKKKALEKLEKMSIKIGYPDIIKKNYSELKIIDSNSLIFNIILVKTFNNKYFLESLYEPVDRTRWLMNSHNVNAYYSPNMNEIVFPAGILQEPFFSINQNIALNFGGFGMVIGHEITHGFDDEGSKYDADGNLNNWWTSNDLQKYKELTMKIVKQYEQYQIDGYNINGQLTLGENIADIGGLALSLRAFKKFNQCLENKNKIKINYDPYTTNEQKFFINFANIWKSKGRNEDIQQRILLDVHSPPIFRVNGSLRNIDEFYQVFDIKPTDKLYLKPEDRVRIWA
jgi:putative endopeptidase